MPKPDGTMTVEEIEAAMRRIEQIDANLNEFQRSREKKKKPEATQESQENVFRRRARQANEASKE